MTAVDPALLELIRQVELIDSPPLPPPWPEDGQTDVEWLESVSALRLAHEDAAIARMAVLAGDAVSTATPADDLTVVDHSIPVDGDQILARVYTPFGEGPFPAVVMLHGGGWWMGGGERALAQGDRAARMLATHVQAVVVNVDYRLAPEHRFPIPLEDSYAAFEWVSAQAAALNIRPDRIALMGASAGANLVVGVTQLVRDRNGPAVCFQTLIAPPVNPAMDTASAMDQRTDMGFSSVELAHAWDMYFGPGADRTSPLASPLTAADLSGLPPALVVTAEYDPLRDEGLAYAAKLDAAGVPVVSRTYPMTHGIALPETSAAYLTDLATALRAALHA